MSTKTKIFDLTNNDFSIKFNFNYNSENDIESVTFDVKSNDSKIVGGTAVENINMDLKIETIINFQTENRNNLRGSFKKVFLKNSVGEDNLAIFANLYTGINLEYHFQGIILTFAAKLI